MLYKPPNHSSFKERIGYVISKEGPTATLLWLVKKIARLEAYYVLSADCKRDAEEGDARGEPFRLGLVETPRDIRVIGLNIRAQLEQHLGRALAILVSERAITYFLADDDQVVCQVVISQGPRVRLDTPEGLTLDIGPRSLFLSYLYTHERYRRMGAAQRLMRFASIHSAQRGYERTIAHVSATNVPSLNVFAGSSWLRIGTIWTGWRDRRFLAIGLSAHGVELCADSSIPTSGT